MTVEAAHRSSITERRIGFAQYVHYLRGVAALSVLLFHLSGHLRHAKIESVLSSTFTPIFGVYGVAVFFAISGFLMARTIRKADPGIFLAHRIARIYPLFFLVVVLASALFTLAGTLPVSFHALLLAPVGKIQYPLGVEWTLVFEMSFYVFLFFLMVAGASRWIELVAVLWIVSILLGLAYGVGTTSGLVSIWSFPLAYANIAFASGLLIPRLLQWVSPWMLIPVCVATFWRPALPYPVVMVATGFAAALVVACAAHISERGTSLPGFLHAPLSWLGDCSFALYLCHVPLIRIIYWSGQNTLTAEQLWMSGLAASLCVAGILGAIDLRIYRTLKARIDAAAPHHVLLFSSGFAAIFITVAALG